VVESRAVTLVCMFDGAYDVSFSKFVACRKRLAVAGASNPRFLCLLFSSEDRSDLL
jgi:hypothetical protein